MSWFSSFFSRSKSVTSSPEIFVNSLPYDKLTQFLSNNCCAPKSCFSNCAQAVTNFDLAEMYVLCFVALPNGRRYGHAIVKLSGKYFDPTLQPQGISGLRYWIHSKYTKERVRQMARANFPDVKAVGGHIEVYPPALKSDGTVVYEEIFGPYF